MGTLPAVIPSCYLLAVDATVCLLWAGATALISTVGLSILFVSHTRLRLVSFIIEGTRLVALCVNGVLACLSLTIMLIGMLEGTDTSPQYNAALAVSGALIGGAAIANCVSFAARDSRLYLAMYSGSILSNLLLLLLAARLLVQQPEEIASAVTLYAVVLVSANALGMRLARVRKSETKIEESRFADDSLDVVFIDGDHRYEAVVRDLRIARRAVKPGGAIAVHDYGNRPGVTQAVDELKLPFKQLETLVILENV